MYTVDLEELLDTVGDLARCGEALDALLDQVTARVAALHGGWSGRGGEVVVLVQVGAHQLPERRGLFGVLGLHGCGNPVSSRQPSGIDVSRTRTARTPVTSVSLPNLSIVRPVG